MKKKIKNILLDIQDQEQQQYIMIKIKKYKGGRTGYTFQVAAQQASSCSSRSGFLPSAPAPAQH